MEMSMFETLLTETVVSLERTQGDGAQQHRNVLRTGTNDTLRTPERESRLPAGSDARPTVFVVDHDAAVRASLEPLIRRAGWRSVLCKSAEEFLAQPRVFAPACLVLD